LCGALQGRELLEINPLCLIGNNMSAVHAVVALEDPSQVPADLWPKVAGMEIRVPEVVVVRVWPFVDGVYQRFFAPPPPPPF
jgi:hypothetical protein